MKAINATAQATLTKILESVLAAELGACGRIGEKGGTFMAVETARLGESLYSVGHYYEQNGDRCADCEIEFWFAGGKFYPVTYRQDSLGIYRQLVEFGDEGTPVRYNRAAQADTATFCGTWMRNIRAQQAGNL